MLITQENCEKLIVSEKTFQELLYNNPLLDSIEISTQYNCCDNIIFENTITQVDCVRVFLDSVIKMCVPDRTLTLFFNVSGDTLLTPFNPTDIIIDAPTGTIDMTSIVITYISPTEFSVLVEILAPHGTGFTFDISVAGSGLLGGVSSLVTPVDVVIELISGQEYFTFTGLTPLCNTSTTGIEIIDGNIELNYTLFSQLNNEQLADGIYTVTVTFYLIDGTTIQYSNCTFVDCVTACKLATYMATNIGTELSTTLAMVHYALQESEGCECVCEDKCKLFEYLWNNLSTIPTTSGCNCN